VILSRTVMAPLEETDRVESPAVFRRLMEPSELTVNLLLRRFTDPVAEIVPVVPTTETKWPLPVRVFTVSEPPMVIEPVLDEYTNCVAPKTLRMEPSERSVTRVPMEMLLRAYRVPVDTVAETIVWPELGSMMVKSPVCVTLPREPTLQKYGDEVRDMPELDNTRFAPMLIDLAMYKEPPLGSTERPTEPSIPYDTTVPLTKARTR
jgi:hypothetical protein